MGTHLKSHIFSQEQHHHTRQRIPSCYPISHTAVSIHPFLILYVTDCSRHRSQLQPLTFTVELMFCRRVEILCDGKRPFQNLQNVLKLSAPQYQFLGIKRLMGLHKQVSAVQLPANHGSRKCQISHHTLTAL